MKASKYILLSRTSNGWFLESGLMRGEARLPEEQHVANSREVAASLVDDYLNKTSPKDDIEQLKVP